MSASISRPTADAQRRAPVIAEAPGFDPNRDKGNISPQSNIKDGVDPLAFLVGPVTVRYGGDPSRRTAIDTKPYIDHDKKIVKSITGELQWDYGQGICTLDAPKAQGVCGFLKKVGTFKLHEVELQCANEYAAVLAVAMDDKPIAQASRILIQVGTTERPTGWKTKPAHVEVNKNAVPAEEVVDFGHKPWQIVEADLTVLIRNASVKTAYVLDANGMSIGNIPLADDGGMKKLIFPPRAMYVVLK
jgi:hypothetical protein